MNRQNMPLSKILEIATFSPSKMKRKCAIKAKRTNLTDKPQ
jgi:hypothetical protein